MYSFSKMDGFINFFLKCLRFDHTHPLMVITDFSIRFLSLRNLSFKIMLRCSELVCWRYEALLMDEMYMIDRNKIESSVPLTLDRASSVPGDAQEDTSY